MILSNWNSGSIGTQVLRLLVALTIAGILFGGMAGNVVADSGADSSGAASVASGDCLGTLNGEAFSEAQTNITLLSEETTNGDASAGTAHASIADIDPVPLQTGNTTNSTSFCDIKYVSNLMDAAFTVFIGGALVLGLLTWVVTSFAEALPLPSNLKSELKQQRNTAVASMFRTVFVPAVLITLLDATNLVLPSCITVLPF